MRKMIPQITLALVLILIVGLVGIVYAEEKTKPEIVKVERKEVIGDVLSLKPRNNPKYIGIATAGYDAYFLIDKDVRIVHKRSLDEIELGDKISVTYEEVTKVTEEGREESTRTAKVIKFIKEGEGGFRRVSPGYTGERDEPSKKLQGLERKR